MHYSWPHQSTTLGNSRAYSTPIPTRAAEHVFSVRGHLNAQLLNTCWEDPKARQARSYSIPAGWTRRLAKRAGKIPLGQRIPPSPDEAMKIQRHSCTRRIGKFETSLFLIAAIVRSSKHFRGNQCIYTLAVSQSIRFPCYWSNFYKQE